MTATRMPPRQLIISTLLVLSLLSLVTCTSIPGNTPQVLPLHNEASLAASLQQKKILAAAVERILSTVGYKGYLHHNHLGTVSTSTNLVGIVNGRARFNPAGSISQTPGYTGVYGFTGQEIDQSASATRFKHRLLDSQSGRWLSPDPLFAVAMSSSIGKLGQSTGAYGYVAGRLVTMNDPTGLIGVDGKLDRVFQQDGREKNTITGSEMEKSGFNLVRVGSAGVKRDTSVKDAGFIGHTAYNEGDRTQRFALPDSEGNFDQVSPEVMADRIQKAYPRIETVVIMGCHAAAQDQGENGTMVERVARQFKKEHGRDVTVIGAAGEVSFKFGIGRDAKQKDTGAYNKGTFSAKGNKKQKKLKGDDKFNKSGRALGQKK